MILILTNLNLSELILTDLNLFELILTNFNLFESKMIILFNYIILY